MKGINYDSNKNNNNNLGIFSFAGGPIIRLVSEEEEKKMTFRLSMQIRISSIRPINEFIRGQDSQSVKRITIVNTRAI